MKHVVGVGEAQVSADPADILVTHALGSCIGVVAYDPTARVGGLLHAMLPQSRINPQRALDSPCVFVDTGVPLFFRQMYAAGAEKKRLVVKVAGGASINSNAEDGFAIGKRNLTILRKLFWKNGIVIEAEDVGGSCARTMYLEMDTGRVWLLVNGKRWEL